MPRSKILSLVAVLAIAVAACGGAKATTAPQSGGQGSAAPGSSDAVVVVPSFAKGGGSCGVQIDGDVTKSWHTDQTVATLLVSDWLNASDRSMLAVKDGEEMLLINCQSDQGSISFTTTAATTAAQFPKAPGTYVIEAGGIVADRKPGEIQTVINLKDSNLWRVTEPGTFEITSFTPSHLAGSFTFKIGSYEVGSSAATNTASISGTFDLACTGSACS
jgi:hypothetical protein